MNWQKTLTNKELTSVRLPDYIQGPRGQSWKDLDKVFQEMELAPSQTNDELELTLFTHKVRPDLIFIRGISFGIGSGEPSA